MWASCCREAASPLCCFLCICSVLQDYCLSASILIPFFALRLQRCARARRPVSPSPLYSCWLLLVLPADRGLRPASRVLLLFPLSSQPSNHILVSLLCTFVEAGGAAVVITPLIIPNNFLEKSANLVESDSHHIGSVRRSKIYGQIRGFGCDP